MPTVVPVKFKYAAHDLWFAPAGSGVVEADHVICKTERGREIGLATADPFEVSAKELHDTCGDAPLRDVVRVATEDDLTRADALAEKGERAFATFKKMVHESDLDMKPVGVEYLFEGERVVCYFSAEERVDFRKLVRDLSHALHERVDMRQIGVREEAAIIGGYGHCGQELCCRRFGHQFEPVSIRMAKEQDLPLNSSKISGACGRLMCCLRYEFEAYRDFKQRAPKRNAVIETPLGKAKIVEYDTPKEEIALRLENGKTIRVPLAGMTASEAAHKKSEELGCPCRPDTVTRAALDRLQSPDVQMALAELDREHGVIPPEPTFHESDIFVDAGGSGRKGQAGHRRKRSTAQGGRQEEGASEQARKPTTRRRHHKGGGAAEAAQGQGQQQRPAPRHAAPQASATDAQGATTTRHRRRHHKGAEGATSQQGGRQQQAERGRQGSNWQGAQDAQQPRGGGMRPSRRHRHPGDHGGAQAQQQGGKKPAQQPHAQAERGEGQQAPRKRHRHHRGGGSGPSGAGGQKPSDAPGAGKAE